MMKKSAIFSPCRKYRYVLWRTWNQDNPYAMFVCLNPSTADETSDDPTVRRCIRYAQDWNYGALCMTNLFGFRTTEPRILKATKEPVGKSNDRWLKRLSESAGIVIVAWGVHGGYAERDKLVLQLLNKPYYLKLTKGGYPAHPLYLPKNLKPIKWEQVKLEASIGL